MRLTVLGQGDLGAEVGINYLPRVLDGEVTEALGSASYKS